MLSHMIQLANPHTVCILPQIRSEPFHYQLPSTCLVKYKAHAQLEPGSVFVCVASAG